MPIIYSIIPNVGGSGGGVASNSFGTVQPISGTSPTASIPSDIVTFSSGDGSISIGGSASTKNLDFRVTAGGSAGIGATGSFVRILGTTNSVFASTSAATLTFVSSDSSMYVGASLSTSTMDFKMILSAPLSALSSYNTNGLITQTAANTFTGRTVTGTANKITVTNGDGVAGNPTVTVGTDIVQLTSTQSLTNKTLDNTNTITLKDTLFTLQDDGDTTKQAVFQLSGIATATTRTITLPDASGTATLQGNSTTGSGLVVLQTSPTLITPVLGVATATSINKTAITAPATSSTIAVADGKTLTSSNTLTLAGTDSTTITFQATDTYTGRTTTDTLTNKRITKRTGTTASSATPTINTDNVDYYSITALAAAITSFTTNLSGTPTDAQTLWISITDNATARAITWGTSFEASTVALPTTTVVSTRLDVGFVWNTVTSKFRCVATS